MKTTLLARLVALGSAVAVTFSLVSLLADYGLPQADTSVQLALASKTSSK